MNSEGTFWEQKDAHLSAESTYDHIIIHILKSFYHLNIDNNVRIIQMK